MDKVLDILQSARKNGISISLDKDQLSIKYSKGMNIDSKLIEEIKDNKELIIDFLSNKSKVKKSHGYENKISHIPTHENQNIPLSFSQERLWFIDQLEGSAHYHIPVIWRLKGNLNKDALSKALKEIINRHQVLRTVILEKDGNAFQSVKPVEDWHLELIDGAAYLREDDLQKHIEDLIRKPFDLSKDYMLRAHLITLNAPEYLLIITMHHIASDGWSVSVLITELQKLYDAYISDGTLQLPILPVQYSDYALWQRNYLQGELLDKKIKYWKEKLKDVASLQLPTDHQRPVEWTNNGALIQFDIDKLLSTQLQDLSKQQETTLFMTMLAAFNVLLHKYSGQQDICVGTPIANRTYSEIEGLIGFFVNTLALRSQVESEFSFKELLQQIKVNTLEAYEHQDVPFEKVVEVVVKERDMSRNPLFQVMLVMQNNPKVHAMQLGDVQISNQSRKHESAKFDITIHIIQTENGLEGLVEYATDLYEEATINRMIGHFKTLLHSIVKNQEQKISELIILTTEEEHQLLLEFNNTAANYPKDKTIINLFEEQVAETPEAIAVKFEQQQLTYKELNERANQLAHYLISKGVKTETLVPICIERSHEMIIGILGILKAGCAYVPIDPEYPQERINYMLQDTAAHILVSSKYTHSKLLDIQIEFIEIDDIELIKQSPQNLHTNIEQHNLAYVIYTSGSTGKPKGVLIEHRSVVNLIEHQKREFEMSAGEKILQFSNYSFDASVEQIFLSFRTGSTLLLVNKELQADQHALLKVIIAENVTHLHATPSYLETIPAGKYGNLKRVIAGGEICSLNLAKAWGMHVDFFNEYGPTETTVTIIEIKYKPALNILPIGIPISNASIYILNQKEQLVPIGITGEICIGGDGLSRGYLNLPELTTEKFIKNRFNEEEGSKLYKTGDLGKWLADGNIEYLGRMDDQVKIRGYRIELGEIENVLQQCKEVSQAVILAKEDSNGNKRLVGYVIPKNIFDKEAIVSYLRNKLPEYMVPAIWVKLETLPLTANGKIDRKALPDPDASEQLSDQYISPGNKLEIKLADIWKELLDVNRIGVHDNFFDLGGHSLLAMRVISAIRKELQVELSIKDIFQNQTILDLSEYIEFEYNFDTEPDTSSLKEIIL